MAVSRFERRICQSKFGEIPDALVHPVKSGKLGWSAELVGGKTHFAVMSHANRVWLSGASFASNVKCDDFTFGNSSDYFVY